MLRRAWSGPRLSRGVLGLRLPGVHASAPLALRHAARHLQTGASVPAARDLEAAATGVGDPAVAQLLEEYVVGWAAGSIPRYRQTPHPPGTLPGLSRWCRTLRHDIMRDLCQPHGQPGAVQAAVGAPGQSSGGEAQGASRPKAAAPTPRRRKMKNSVFRRAERERLLFDRGESWRERQRRKEGTRKKWAKVMDEAPLLSFLARLAAEGKLGDG